MRHIDREARILELAAGKRVLHLGCVGHEAEGETNPASRYDQSLHAKIQRVASEVVGVDTNAERIEEYAQAGLETGMVVGSVERLETLGLGEPFDFIVSGNVIEHLSSPGAMLDGMRALSHPGTVIMVTTPHALALATFIRHLRGRFTDSSDHMMTFNGPSLSNVMTRHGFRVLSVDTGYQQLSRMRPRQRLARVLFKRFPRFGRVLIAQAELP